MRRQQDLGTKLYKDSPQVEFLEFKIIQISKASTEVSQSQGRHRLWSDKDINMSSCLPRMALCHFCTFKQNSNTECRKYFAVCCLENSKQRMLHQGQISLTGARFLNHG